MGFYSQLIFPRLCDLFLDRPFVAQHRRALLAHAFGDVLEIGFGTGLNLPHYSGGIRKITAVDPNPGMHKLAKKRIKETAIEVEQRLQRSERLEFEVATFDCAVSTFTLCSVASAERVVAEIYRVLKPGGTFLFLEHGLSPEAGVQKWQRRLNRLQIFLANGCRLDRNVEALVAAQPFGSVEIEQFYLEKTPRTHGYVYWGMARK